MDQENLNTASQILAFGWFSWGASQKILLDLGELEWENRGEFMNVQGSERIVKKF